MQGLHLTADLHRCRCDSHWLLDAQALGRACVDAVNVAGLQAVAEHHRRVHHRGRMQRVHGHLRGIQLLGQRHRERHLRELGLRVGRAALVVALQHHVIEIHRPLGARGHVDDSRRRAGLNLWQQLARQQEVREVVDGEGELVAVPALAAWVAGAAQDAGVVDEQMQPRMRRTDARGELAHVLQRTQVTWLVGCAPRTGRGDLGRDGAPPALVQTVHDDRGAHPTQAPRNHLAQSAGRAGDQGRLAVHVDYWRWRRGVCGNRVHQEQQAEQGCQAWHWDSPGDNSGFPPWGYAGNRT